MFLNVFQRFYMILSPGGDAKKSPNRLVVVGTISPLILPALKWWWGVDLQVQQQLAMYMAFGTRMTLLSQFVPSLLA